MAEYIEREKAITYLENHKRVAKEQNFILSADEDAIIKFLKEKCPTADVVEVKHGEWLLLDECANEGVYCSVCRKKVYKTSYANQKIKSAYCPNCGAKMGKKEGDVE